MVDWFTGRLHVGSIATLLAAFVIGFIARSTTTFEPGIPKPIRQYGYRSKRSPDSRRSDGDPGCPFEYLLNIYGRHHFEPFVREFRPKLKEEDPVKYSLVLDIMDAVHFALVLVDDISDDSTQRKGKPAAHLIYGASETANRAYFVLTKVINRALRERLVLGLELMKALENILHGQDLSLVWRRDGLASFHCQGGERVAAYKTMAGLKTGTLFVLIGRLLNDGGDELDDLLTRFGWYAQLQNDCKNIYSAEYATSKGAVAEDLRNGELSFPIIIALSQDNSNQLVEKALHTRAEEDIEAAVDALQSPRVKETCMKALQEAGCGMERLALLWGRREKMGAGS
ncbi:Geranylgeranyl pyrophosphate synthase-like protein [Hapsidospora chrysogenum ATCC 11550]|uniref:Geranylgeranyl pyrophosphate synthase-like protein n=1 Tax=Hapsidospora chrysogenum (strain ATCC 11550 / CBS 779.69 / DSM 880 / IAM 14645 / JCM 23072 / IMI 49137) TaxID=857340 RepID=A0A086T408_HAPC1|nr:Geranylgeranyl pyrophosphate synthase-like protein [Hapsidospora chrysogenum ATCC 11550]